MAAIAAAEARRKFAERFAKAPISAVGEKGERAGCSRTGSAAFAAWMVDRPEVATEPKGDSNAILGASSATSSRSRSRRLEHPRGGRTPKCHRVAIASSGRCDESDRCGSPRSVLSARLANRTVALEAADGDDGGQDRARQAATLRSCCRVSDDATRSARSRRRSRPSRSTPSSRRARRPISTKVGAVPARRRREARPT